MQAWVLPYREFRRLHERAYRAQQRDQSEVVGLLVRRARRRLGLSFLKNHSGRPGHFEVPIAGVAAERRQVGSRGARVVGVFHSHPVSPAMLGVGDRRAAMPNSLQLVYDVCGLDARLWRVTRRAGRKRVSEVALRVEKSKSRLTNRLSGPA
jgi:proteasome lid subunit RPN8/RPN11